jgi:aminoglycoside 3-N-acetyltransferase
MNNSEIYKEISRNIVFSLKNLKLKNSDNIYLGINLGAIIEKNSKQLFSSENVDLKKIRTDCAKLVFKTLSEYFLNGTIIVPSFNFDYFKSKKFNRRTTTTSLGYFENFFIKQKNIVRSEHPIFSISVIGKNKNKFITPCGPFSFGINSPFNNFLKYKVKFLNLGIKFKDTCTYLHHVEHLNGVNHRYYKPVRGKIFKNNKYINKTYYSFVRFNFLKSKKAEYKIEKNLKDKKLISEQSKYGFYTSVVKAVDVYNCASENLIKNPSYFMTSKTIVKVER